MCSSPPRLLPAFLHARPDPFAALSGTLSLMLSAASTLTCCVLLASPSLLARGAAERGATERADAEKVDAARKSDGRGAARPGVVTKEAAGKPPRSWRDDSLMPADNWNTLSVETTVKRRHLTAAGKAIGVPVPDASYRLERSNRGGRWKTTITVLSAAPSPSYSLSGAMKSRPSSPVSRIESDEDGGPLRLFDAAGRELPPLGTPSTLGIDAPPPSGSGWLEALVPSKSRSGARLAEYERRFGRGVRSAAGTQFRRVDGELVETIVIEPDASVPLERHQERNGKALSRQRFAYGEAASGYLARTQQISELLGDEAVDDWAVVETTFSNIRLERR